MPDYGADATGLTDSCPAIQAASDDATDRAGRHNFIQNWNFGTSSSVFLCTTSEDGEAVHDADHEYVTRLGNSEIHHSLAMASLIDQSSTTHGWKGANRGTESSGAGHWATQNVFWSTWGDGILPPTSTGSVTSSVPRT